MITEGGATPEQRIAWAFRRATCRAPGADELKVLTDGLAKRIARFQQSPDEAATILAVGETKSDAKINPVELAAYTATAHLLLNRAEFITRGTYRRTGIRPAATALSSPRTPAQPPCASSPCSPPTSWLGTQASGGSAACGPARMGTVPA